MLEEPVPLPRAGGFAELPGVQGCGTGGDELTPLPREPGLYHTSPPFFPALGPFLPAFHTSGPAPAQRGRLRCTTPEPAVLWGSWLPSLQRDRTPPVALGLASRRLPLPHLPCLTFPCSSGCGAARPCPHVPFAGRCRGWRRGLARLRIPELRRCAREARRRPPRSAGTRGSSPPRSQAWHVAAHWEAPAVPAGQVPPAAPAEPRPRGRGVQLSAAAGHRLRGTELPGKLFAPGCPAMASEEEHPSALSDNQVLVLTWIYLAASLLSLLGSGSILAVTSRQRRCCHVQLRPLFLLALADVLAAATLLSTATIQLLPAPLFIPAYAACPYGLMLATTFYAVSFLMVVVYAYEAYRAVRGRGAWHVAALQERSQCLESAWRGLPYVLAWLVPALTLLGQLIARGTSRTDIAPRPLEPVEPGRGNRSHETYSLYCSSCLLLIRRAQDICYEYVGRKDAGLEGKIIFFLYLLLVLSTCTLLYRRVKLWCRRKAAAPLLTPERDGFAGRSIRSVSRVSHYFQLVFLLCWAPAFLLTLLSFTSIKPASVFALYVTTALTISLQGFLHSLVYGWLRQNFRREVVGKGPSPQQHHRGLKAFYDDSQGPVL